MYIFDATVNSSKYHIQLSCYGDNVVWKLVHQHDAFVTVDIQLINEAKPVDHQTRAEPRHKSKIQTANYELHQQIGTSYIQILKATLMALSQITTVIPKSLYGKPSQIAEAVF